jgi:flagellar hook-associated protein 3 FlgL
MIGRVTQSTTAQQLVSSIRLLQQRINQAQNELSSGKRLLAPSDDPSAAAVANRLRGQSADLTALQDSVSFGTTVLSAEDDALGQAGDLLTRAQEIASQQAGGLSSAQTRQQAADEVAELERSLIALGNTQVDGRAVFGGLASGSAPFTTLDDPNFDPQNPYSGPSTPFAVRTSSSGTTRLTTPGDQVFGSSIAALDGLRQTLLAGNAPTASIDALNQAANDLSAERTSVGDRANTLSDQATALGSGLTDVQARLGSVEGADYATVITQLTQLQTALQATYASGQILQTSILDYLKL